MTSLFTTESTEGTENDETYGGTTTCGPRTPPREVGVPVSVISVVNSR